VSGGHPPGGFIGELQPADCAALAGVGRLRHYRPGAVLMREGDESDQVLLLTEGRAKVTSTTTEGRELLLAVRGPGELIGELAAIDGGPRSASVVALGPSVCRVLRVEEFLGFVEAHPRAALVLLRTFTRRLRDSDRRRAEFGSLDATHRLARLVIELADEYGRTTNQGGVEIGLRLTQEELAGMIATSRESVARALTSLRSRGLIATSRRTITLRDPGRLRIYAG
jgi:CRP/FNR family transcriptional regulator, cyclic AMP receptor protein